MRLLLILILFLIPISALAAHIKCYSNGKLIYSAYAEEIYYAHGVLMFNDKNTKHDTFIRARCMVRY